MTKLIKSIIGHRTALAGLLLLVLVTAIAIAAPLIAPHPDAAESFHIDRRLMPPSSEAILGTDRMGSDIFSRVILGARMTLLITAAVVCSGVIIGVPIGLIAGYFNTGLSIALMGVAEVLLAVPQIILAIAITQSLGPSIGSVILALSITYWPFWARLVYAETRSICNEIFVESAIALGASSWRVIFLHILPNIASSIVVRTTVAVGTTMFASATLGFLGLGPPPPSPEWGRMIAESREYLPEAWWYAAAPGLALFVTVLGFSLFGDGLRDILDPKTRRSG
ncbi:ABC transporter permease [Ancylobacter oerskovii]|uniref:ABC transporter permease n=1 Tax=Ancylobacter oerskovii TaxID=459519 RepID=A0ABW4YZS9_9HYPH|nr:ABC transporter permease [Ancylobacter oerskovii]MBS7543813.1 ABC transporter permease [Ancylobacter oerskovii]